MTGDLESNLKSTFWDNGKMWHPILIFLISFLTLIIFSSTNILLLNARITEIFVVGIGPLAIFILLYMKYTEKTKKPHERIKQVLTELHLMGNKKYIKETMINLIVWSFFSFAIVLPIITSKIDIYNYLGYPIDFNVYDLLFVYFNTLIYNILFVTIWEEILFRGYFFNICYNKIKRGRLILSMLSSSLLFAIYHMFVASPFSYFIYLPSAFIFGIFLCYNLSMGKNLWSNIIIHANVNYILYNISNTIAEINDKLARGMVNNVNTTVNDILNKISQCAKTNGFNEIDNCIKNAIAS
ncbi:MAG: type II CAAX endopeptidase family protein [Candidatus Aenigmarchaeota archaeon]|nr:type II CAAX endopeptidase family protein [Candidatus Aenigmarchaeota archaeon]